MNPVAVKTRYTPEDLLAMPDGDRYELVGGELEELNVGWNAGYISGRIHFFLTAFCEQHRLGVVAPAESGYQCFPDDPQKVRKPDVSFLAYDRLPPSEQREGYCRIAPNLAVEVVSPHDLFTELATKVDEYLDAGVQAVWIVDPGSRTVRIERQDGTYAKLAESDELSGEDVLPGFTCRVAQIFAEPKPSSAAS